MGATFIPALEHEICLVFAQATSLSLAFALVYTSGTGKQGGTDVRTFYSFD